MKILYTLKRASFFALCSYGFACSDWQAEPAAIEKNTLPQQTVLYENFDTGTALPNNWRANKDAMASVSSELAYSKPNAVKIQAKGGGYNRNFLIYDLRASPQLETSLYGSFMLYVSDEGNKGGDFTLVQTLGKAKPESGAPINTAVAYRLRVDGRHEQLMANYDTWPQNKTGEKWQTDCWKHPNGDGGLLASAEYQLVARQWRCIQWHFDNQNNQLKFWQNGQELHDINVLQTGDGCIGNKQEGNWYGPQKFEHLMVGIEQYHQSAQARTIYIDDIRLDDKPVFCE
ncbi:hypothetical protein SAMN02745866_00670 [Alteromonadaceae bacterium Bs31]|nr:hypothetical protein SAMN02745866_00670 [Alteromonadaceae bacterium Bs31]